MRVRLDIPNVQDHSESTPSLRIMKETNDSGGDNAEEEEPGEVSIKFTKTLDMRIAWGPTAPRLPGL